MNATASSPVAEPEHARYLGAGRVLLAEDDFDMRSMLSFELRQAGYDVVEAANGKELIYRLADATSAHDMFDCIVTDVRMPKLNGLEAMGYARAGGVDLPVVLITAFGDQQTRIEARALGAAAVIDKPFEMSQLLQELSRLKAAGHWK
jgi:CheY-like chemotaxis protein